MSGGRGTLVLTLLSLSSVASHTGHDHGHHNHHDHDDHAHGHHHHGHDDHHDHSHDDHDHGHDDHDHDHDFAHGDVELNPETWESEVLAHPHVWAVRFHSSMCGTCQAFNPAWEQTTQAVEGLHWGSVNIDKRENVKLAKKLGVLKEGIPNVKLINAAEAGAALKVMGDGDLFDGDELTDKLKSVLSTSATLDSSNFYVGSGSARVEL